MVVTSRTGKALADFMRALGSHADQVREIDTVTVSLKSPDDIAQGLRDAADASADVIVLIRGGGSVADLQPFNTRSVVETVAELAQSIPVVVGVGHDQDDTLVKRVASHVASTPASAGYLVAQAIARAAPRSTPALSASSPPSDTDGRMRLAGFASTARRFVRGLIRFALIFGVGWACGWLYAKLSRHKEVPAAHSETPAAAPTAPPKPAKAARQGSPMNRPSAPSNR